MHDNIQEGPGFSPQLGKTFKMCLDKFDLALLCRKVNLDVPDRQADRMDLFELGVVGKILIYFKCLS